MSEIIDLVDSSDDEQPTTTMTTAAAARTKTQGISPTPTAVICLLDDDDDENEENFNASTIKFVSQESTDSSDSCRKRKNKRKSTQVGISCNDNSDSGDSLDQYFASGLSRSTKVSKKQSPPSTTAAATPAATKTSATTLVDIATSSSSSNVTIGNPYAGRPKITPPSKPSSAASAATTITPASGGTQLLVANPYASKKKKTTLTVSAPVNTATITNNLIPTRLTSRGKTYPDLRAKITLCLWKYSRTLTRQSYDRGKLDQIVKKIVALSLAEYPIRSLEEYIVRFQGHTPNAVSTFRIKLDELREQLETGGWSRASTSVDSSINGKYYTIAEACLVACLTRLQLQEGVTNNVGLEAQLSLKDNFIPASWLLPEIDRRLHLNSPAGIARPSDPDQGVDFYTQPSTISAEYKQIEKLCSQSIYLKPRRNRGKLCYELTPLGYKMAQQLQSRVYPAPLGPYRCCNQVDLSNYSNIIMGMDLREGGGGTKNVLHTMCNKLDWTKLPYFVTSLAIGDYIFLHKNKLVPVLIERKSVQDVAQSIYDGRWHRQKRRMYHGQYVFGYGQSRLAFIIEGKQERHQVTGGFIGNAAFQVSLDRLNEELDNLKTEGFDVLRTSSPENSMFELARWAKQIARQVNAGNLEANYTYQEFKDLVAKIPSGTDLSRLAKDHYQHREAASRAVAIDSASNDECLEVEKPNPKRLTYAVDYAKWTKGQLEQACIKHGLSKSGASDKLVERLLKPHPPSLWVQRKNKGEWVPARHDVAGTALLVALWLLHQEYPSQEDGFSKNQVYVRAEALCISKNPFSGGTTQTGPYHYDGWSSMGCCMKGDPPLVAKKKNKFRLTRSCSISGYPLAEQLHEWCHAHNNCSCQDL